MTGDPLRAKPGGDGDSWESLAQDLFGIEFSNPLSNDDLPLPDESTPLNPAEAEHSHGSQGESDVEPAAGRSERPSHRDEIGWDSDDDADDDFGDELLEDDQPSAEDSDELSADDSDEPEEVEEVASESGEPRADDAYWDALNDWQWEDAPRERPAEKGGQRSSGRRPERKPSRDSARPSRDSAKPSRDSDKPPRESAKPATPAPPAYRATDDFPDTSDLRDEYIDDDAFGAGLLEGNSGPAGQTAASAAGPDDGPITDSDRETSGDQDDRRRRRRRRRRRSRPDAAAAAESAETNESVESSEEEVDDLEVIEDEASSEEEGETTESERGERRPRRRRRRRDESPAGESRHATERPARDAESEDEDDEEDDTVARMGDGADEDLDSQLDGSGEATYRNIPTWEEAIAYLLNPSRVESAPREGAPPRSPDKGSGDRPPEERGHRHKSGSRPPGRRRRRR